MAEGVRADVSIERGHVVVRPRGAAKFWALRSKVRVPLRAITSVELVDDPRDVRRKMRAFGSSIPGFVAAGVFGFTQPRSFWIVGTARPLVVINTTGSNYAHIVFSSDDPSGTKATIEAALASSPQR